MNIKSLNELLVLNAYAMPGQSKIIVMLQGYMHIIILNTTFFSINRKYTLIIGTCSQ